MKTGQSLKFLKNLVGNSVLFKVVFPCLSYFQR